MFKHLIINFIFYVIHSPTIVWYTIIKILIFSTKNLFNVMFIIKPSTLLGAKLFLPLILDNPSKRSLVLLSRIASTILSINILSQFFITFLITLYYCALVFCASLLHSHYGVDHNPSSADATRTIPCANAPNAQIALLYYGMVHYCTYCDQF